MLRIHDVVCGYLEQDGAWGATYFIPAVIVPALIISDLMVFKLVQMLAAAAHIGSE